MSKLSHRQSQILEFIEKFSQEHSYPPTVRDIRDKSGMRSRNNTLLSTSVIDYNLHRIAALRPDKLRLHSEISRGIELVKDEPESITLMDGKFRCDLDGWSFEGIDALGEATIGITEGDLLQILVAGVHDVILEDAYEEGVTGKIVFIPDQTVR